MKKMRFLLGIVCALAVLVPVSFAQETPLVIQVQKLSERVIVLDVQGELNITAINSQKGIVVIDTTISPIMAQMVRERIEKEFGRKDFAYVINTHFHGDHTYGNQVFKDVPIIGHTDCAPGMLEREPSRKLIPERYAPAVQQMKGQLDKLESESETAQLLTRRIPYYQAMIDGLGKGFVLIPPTITFSDIMVLDLGDLTLELSYYGTCHSNTDTLISCPEEGLWMTGDLFSPGNDPYVDSERIDFLPRWEENLEKMLATEESVRWIVPGHGGFLSIDDLKSNLDFTKKAIAMYAGKASAFIRFKEILEESGMEEALEALREMKTQEEKYYVLFPEIDQYAYRKMLTDELDEALAIFLVMADLFPESDVAFDSLGEVYMRKGNTEKAISSFERSLELNPDNGNAAEKLKTLKK